MILYHYLFPYATLTTIFSVRLSKFYDPSLNFKGNQIIFISIRKMALCEATSTLRSLKKTNFCDVILT